MFCTQCGSKIADSSRFCCLCGHRVRTLVSPAVNQYAEDKTVPFSDTPSAFSSEKKGRIWPPILILVILFGIGLSLFLCFRTPAAVTDPAMPWFTVQDGTLYFNEGLYTGGAELTVPATLAGEKVKVISDGCFANSRRLIEVFLPESIEHIGDGAFAHCASLRGILVPESVKSLGSSVFYGCTKLEAVCIPYTVKTAGSDLFTGCEKLRHIFYPGPVESWKLLEIDMTGLNAHIYCHDGTILPN